MKQEHKNWITHNVKGNTYGRCDELTTAMKQYFPNLRKVRGFYHCPVWGRRTHWWLESPDGQIIDPSSQQFPSRGYGEYQEVADKDLSELVPVGRCMECMADVYENFEICGFCSIECHDAFATSLL